MLAFRYSAALITCYTRSRVVLERLTEESQTKVAEIFLCLLDRAVE